MANRKCHFCQTECEDGKPCPTCVAAFPTRRPVISMTVKERLAELKLWFGVAEIDFQMIHQRIEELVGRPVWTHELAAPELLYAELTSGAPATFEEVVEKFPAELPVIILNTEEQGDGTEV